MLIWYHQEHQMIKSYKYKFRVSLDRNLYANCFTLSSISPICRLEVVTEWEICRVWKSHRPTCTHRSNNSTSCSLRNLSVAERHRRFLTFLCGLCLAVSLCCLILVIYNLCTNTECCDQQSRSKDKPQYPTFKVSTVSKCLDCCSHAPERISDVTWLTYYILLITCTKNLLLQLCNNNPVREAAVEEHLEELIAEWNSARKRKNIIGKSSVL